MNEQPLLDAIAANPDSEMQRLIYADFLEERGDPWAEVWRSGRFTEAMGWKPWQDEHEGEYRWWNSSVDWQPPDSNRGDIPVEVLLQMDPGEDEIRGTRRLGKGTYARRELLEGSRSFFYRDEAITAANRAFILAWCNGWRPAQADCRGGVRLVGGETPTEVTIEMTPVQPAYDEVVGGLLQEVADELGIPRELNGDTDE